MSPELTFFVANRASVKMAALSFVEWEVVTCLILVMCKMGYYYAWLTKGLVGDGRHQCHPCPTRTCEVGSHARWGQYMVFLV